MAKVTVTGMREYSFKDDRDRVVEGMSVYYIQPLTTDDGLAGKGYTCGKLPVRKDSELYTRMLRANYDKPFQADVVYDLVPGRKSAVLADIQF